MKKAFFTIFLASFYLTALFSDDNFVFAPFVSRLKVYEENSALKLTWKDSRDIKGTYLIYRHTEPIDRNNFNDAFLVDEIPAGAESFSDKAAGNTGFYYAVVAKNTNGDVFNIFLPYRNITSVPVSIKTIRKIGDNSASVRYLTASAKNDSVILSFDSSQKDRNLAVLRYVEPIFTRADISDSTLLNVIPSHKKSYTDYPIPGVPYYYAIVDSELLKNLEAELVPFENTMLGSIELPVPEKPEDSRYMVYGRTKPLPGVKLFSFLESGKKFESYIPEYGIKKQAISASTASAVNQIIEKHGSVEGGLNPVILDADYSHATDSAELRLSIIIEKYFRYGNWKESETNLENLMKTETRKSFSSRCHFYLGQVKYYLGEPENAVISFIAASDNYYPESRIWIEKILFDMSKSEVY